jgi:hypothetical protein
MRVHVQLIVILLLGGFAVQRAVALEVNYWPLFTGERDEEQRYHSVEMAGPIVFGRSTPTEEIFGVRPFFVGFVEREADRGSFHLLYPIFNLRHRPYGRSWDVFNLIRFQSFTPEEADASRSLHLFPIVFWREDPDPERSYFGIFPVAGSAQNFFTYDEATWFLFPLTARFSRGDVTTYAMPWPFIRVVRGPETSGFHLWPLYGQVARENVSSHRYWLWPLGYSVERELWKEEPFQAFGFLPFYARSSSDRAVSQTFIWPFFGYTDSQRPEYSETRYFWPLLVQRRGSSYRNRWAPVYTRSIRAGTDTRWVMWPLHRYSTWEFYSYWDNGAGRQQFQTLSPFEVFFPFNEVVRAKYSPLFSVYRMDLEEGVRSRHSVLFNFITTRTEVEEGAFHLNVGPLVTYGSGPDRREWTVLKGLLSYARQGEERSVGMFWLRRSGFAGEVDAPPPVRRPRRASWPRRRISERRGKPRHSFTPTRNLRPSRFEASFGRSSCNGHE